MPAVKKVGKQHTYRGKGVKVMIDFTHLDHDKGIDLDGGDTCQDGEGGVGDDGNQGGVGEEDQHEQNTGED